MQHELEQERKHLVKLMNQAFDDGDELLGDEYLDELDELAKIINSGITKLQYYEGWNAHLDFDLHDKLKKYGYTGSSRLNKIFIKGN